MTALTMHRRALMAALCLLRPQELPRRHKPWRIQLLVMTACSPHAARHGMKPSTVLPVAYLQPEGCCGAIMYPGSTASLAACAPWSRWFHEQKRLRLRGYMMRTLQNPRRRRQTLFHLPMITPGLHHCSTRSPKSLQEVLLALMNPQWSSQADQRCLRVMRMNMICCDGPSPISSHMHLEWCM
jgi:hypothetical protein